MNKSQKIENTESLYAEIEAVDWGAFVCPESYIPEIVPAALMSLVSLENAAEKEKVYNSFLTSLGNNHAGTYYPAMQAAIPFIITVVNTGSDVAKSCALMILIDLYTSFTPEIGNSAALSANELEKNVRQLIRSMDHQLSSFITNNNEKEENRILAQELLNSIIQ